MKSEVVLFDSFGNPVSSPTERLTSGIPNKQAMGLVGNIFNNQNVSSFRTRNYTLEDNNSGLDTVSRELVVRWSREMREQLPFVDQAITLMGEHVVGEDGYFAKYEGTNTDWWNKYAEPFVMGWMQAGCVRGMDFQSVMALESEWIDIDGDFLCEYAQPSGYPRYNIIPSNRVRSPQADNYIYPDGPLEGSMVNDGVIYNMDGSTKGWNVKTINNLVNNTGTNETDTFVSCSKAQLIFHPKYFDKNRGRPSITSGILSAISLTELYSYLEEKAKLESCVAMKEYTPTGEAPANLAATMALYNKIQSQLNDGSITTPLNNQFGVQIIQGPTTRYLKSNGGDLQLLAGQTTGENTLEFIQRIESKILWLIGLPPQFLYTTEQATGKISDVVMINFHKAIKRRQKLLDRHAKFLISWALSVAMKNKIIPKNDSEDITKVIKVTHPELPDANKYYTDEMIMKQVQSGVAPIEKATQHFSKMTPLEVIKKNTPVAKSFFNAVKEICDDTGADPNSVENFLNSNLNKKDLASLGGNNQEKETSVESDK